MPTMTLDRAFYLPAAELCADVRSDGDAVTYAWVENGKLLAKGFSGRKAKPDFYHQYGNAERRQAALDRFFANAKEVAERKAARAAEKAAEKAGMNAVVDFPVGTILVSSGGYEQTNVDWYKVVGHFGRLGLKVVQVGSKTVAGEAGGAPMSGYVEADPEMVRSEVFNVRLVGKDSVGGKKFWSDRAWKWDGKPQYHSWYA
jgi:hypothetical protein